MFTILRALDVTHFSYEHFGGEAIVESIGHLLSAEGGRSKKMV